MTAAQQRAHEREQFVAACMDICESCDALTVHRPFFGLLNEPPQQPPERHCIWEQQAGPCPQWVRYVRGQS
jgi:hypothetical protein